MESPLGDIRMSLGNHLEELRRRVIYGLIGIAIAAAVMLFFGRRLLAIIALPLADSLRAANLDPRLNYFHPSEAFIVYLKVSFVAGLIVALPWVLLQVWKFISVGMYATERRAMVLVVPFSTVMSALGVLFMYYVMLPICLWFFISFAAQFPSAGDGGLPWFTDLMPSSTPAVDMAPDLGETGSGERRHRLPMLLNDLENPENGDVWIKAPEGELRLRFGGKTFRLPFIDEAGSLVRPTIGMKQYIGFVTILSIGIVVAFQLPVVLMILGWTGLVEPDWLASYRPYCVFACFTAGMLLTPSDPMSMVALSLPLWALFEFGLLLMRIVHRRSTEEAGTS